MRRPVVAICNTDLAHHPALKTEGVMSPVSIDHALWDCERCHQKAWIGPKQKLAVTVQGCEAVCYRCIFADPALSEALMGGGMVSLNPGIDQRPRRFPL